jgi:hypothetical protein
MSRELLKSSEPIAAPPRRAGRVVTSLGGVLASLLLHVLLLTPVLMGNPPSKHRALVGLSTGANEQSAMTLVFIDEPKPGIARRVPTDEVTSLLPPSNALLRPVAVPPVPPPTDIDELEDLQDPENASNEVPEEGPDHSMMVGRYLGQINARIERAWIRPRRPIASGLFACRVRIVQANDGRVQEVEILQCDGDVSWQTSLVRAIQSASPLPAPPDPKVFSRKLTLEFHSIPFLPGTDSEGFEPEQKTAMK